jgi:hypothetical protein
VCRQWWRRLRWQGGFFQLCKSFWGNGSGVGQVNGFIILYEIILSYVYFFN